MLLRSSSTPILNSWISTESDHVYQLTRARSVCLTSCFHVQNHYDDHAKMSSETSSPSSAKNHIIMHQCNSNSKKSKNTAKGCKGKEQDSVQDLFSSSWLGEASIAIDEEGSEVDESRPQTLVIGGGVGNNGGNICNGGCGDDKESDGESSGGDGDHGSNSADSYYQRMIEANPGNALLLGNYAKYLKEVKGDMDKAEEFGARAILANPTDGSILSIYAELIWNLHKDASRAESYYDQAVKSAPNDCYILASYAKFLWDVEDDEEDYEDNNEGQQKTSIPHHVSSPKFFQESYHHRPITAAS